jgi:hypothetical protein
MKNWILILMVSLVVFNVTESSGAENRKKNKYKYSKNGTNKRKKGFLFFGKKQAPCGCPSYK